MFSPVLRAVVTSWCRDDDVRNCATVVSDAYSGAPVGTPLDDLSPLKRGGVTHIDEMFTKTFSPRGGFVSSRRGREKDSRSETAPGRCRVPGGARGLVLRARRSQSRASLGLGRKRGSRNCSVVTKLYMYVILVGNSKTLETFEHIR